MIFSTTFEAFSTICRAVVPETTIPVLAVFDLDTYSSWFADEDVGVAAVTVVSSASPLFRLWYCLHLASTDIQ